MIEYACTIKIFFACCFAPMHLITWKFQSEMMVNFVRLCRTTFPVGRIPFNVFCYTLKVSEGRFAGLYDVSFDVFLRRIQRRVAKIAAQHKCGRIVDLGCGTGSQCILLHNKKFDVTGIDLSSKMLEIARKKNAEISFLQRDITSTGFPDSHFDCAIISFVLHMNSEKK